MSIDTGGNQMATERVDMGEQGVEEDCQDWNSIFDRLDIKDGRTDNRIPKDQLLEWVDTLTFQGSVTLEAVHGLNRAKLRCIIHKADLDGNGYIDRAEFQDLVCEWSTVLERLERSKLLTYIRIAAYAEEYRWWPPPVLLLTLSIIQVGMFCYTFPLGEAGLTESPLLFHPDKSVEVWRFVSYSLLHHDISHIVINIILQLLVGVSLEMTNSSWRVGIVYTLGIISGSLLFTLVEPNAGLVGASAGVYALVCAHLSAIILNWKDDNLILRQRLSNRKATSPTFGKFIRIARVLVVLSIVGVDFITVAFQLQDKNSGDMTAYTAHLGGSIAGILVGLIVLENRRVLFWETWLKLFSLFLYLAANLVMIGLVADRERLKYYEEHLNSTITVDTN